MKKKKGFTLIELIASVAIFSISYMYISAATETGNLIYRNDNKKQETIMAAQQLLETLNSRDKVSDFIKKEDSRNFYIAFDSAKLNSISNDLYSSNSDNVFSSSNVWYRKANSVPGNYSECKSDCSDSMFGAMIQISEDNFGSYDYYKLKITVWNLKEKNNYESTLSAYISR